MQSWLAAYEKANNYNWAIVLKGSNEVIGSIAAIDFNEQHENCEIGYAIGKDYWEKGFTTEAVKSVIQFFFAQVGLNRIQAKHDVQNGASGRVMQKAGMCEEGVLRGFRKRADGSFGDYKLWAILRKE